MNDTVQTFLLFSRTVVPAVLMSVLVCQVRFLLKHGATRGISRLKYS